VGEADREACREAAEPEAVRLADTSQEDGIIIPSYVP
jgi:hypothetical protein